MVRRSGRYVVTGYTKRSIIGSASFGPSKFTLHFHAKSKKEALAKARKYLDPEDYSPSKPYAPAGVKKLRVYNRKAKYLEGIENIHYQQL